MLYQALVARWIDLARRPAGAGSSSPAVRASGEEGCVCAPEASGVSPASGGFTLIELIVVIAIIGILATIAMPAMKHAPQRAREAVLKEDLYQMRSAIDQYLADKGHYPGSLDELVSEGYLRRIPEDPVTRSSQTWKVEYASAEDEEDLEPNGDEGGGPGIIDVRSGAEGNGLDGTPFSEW